MTRTVLRYDATWKPLTAVMFVIESAFSAILLATGFRNSPADGVTVGLGAYFGLDAIGTALLFFRKPELQTRVTEDRGQWRSAARECPAGLAVRTPTGDFPVATSGEVPVIGAWMLQTVVATPDASLSLSLKGRDAPLRPSLEERCWWSGLSQSPAPFCRGPGREPVPTSVAFPE
ncbi:MAG: hypothetical protein MUC96_00135 [Myxococcaceae bacterium]|nr:hypothetical protein [Myxococcaceae bacterium]